jgi:hypothetical protein
MTAVLRVVVMRPLPTYQKRNEMKLNSDFLVPKADYPRP